MSNWQRLCDVDPAPLLAWLPAAAWATAWNGISRVWDVPPDLTAPIVAAVLLAVDGARAAKEICLNKIEPGWGHNLHVDGARWAGWITRVHVPLMTNPDCWHLFESEGVKVHMEAGGAYSFDTEARHAFGNDGNTPRVHLLFDVYRS